MSLACQFCGYQAKCSNASDPRCPVCVEPYSAGDGDGTTSAGPGPWSDPVRSSAYVAGRGGVSGVNSAIGVALSPGGLSPELESLLRRLPRKRDKQRRRDEILRAAAMPTAESDKREDGDVVYIRPRVDPTMRVLKVNGGQSFRPEGDTCYHYVVLLARKLRILFQSIVNAGSHPNIEIEKHTERYLEASRFKAHAGEVSVKRGMYNDADEAKCSIR